MQDQNTTNTSPRSRTLDRLGHWPKTACSSCKHAIWQATAAEDGEALARVYCRLLQIHE